MTDVAPARLRPTLDALRSQAVDLETLPAVQQLLDLAGRPAAVAVLVGVPARGARAVQARTVLEGAGVTVCPQVLVHRAAWGDASALGLTVRPDLTTVAVVVDKARGVPAPRQGGGSRRAGTVPSTAPPRSEAAALEAARVADLVVVPCRPKMVDLETFPATQQLLALAGVPAAVAILVAVPPRGPVIGDPNQADAICDRLLHDARRIELKGRSMRRTHDAPANRRKETT